MKKIFVCVLLVLANSVYADTSVRGYYRSDGTYVQPHYRSNPNSTKLDNWSQKGNVNPYTGKYGSNNCLNTYSC